jgi:hypothetical protein
VNEPSNTRQEDLDSTLAAAEPGVAQAIATYEAVEKAYFQAVAAMPVAVVATSYGTTTSPR